jgi:hypothetical protein
VHIFFCGYPGSLPKKVHRLGAEHEHKERSGHECSGKALKNRTIKSIEGLVHILIKAFNMHLRIMETVLGHTTSKISMSREGNPYDKLRPELKRRYWGGKLMVKQQVLFDPLKCYPLIQSHYIKVSQGIQKAEHQLRKPKDSGRRKTGARGPKHTPVLEQGGRAQFHSLSLITDISIFA